MKIFIKFWFFAARDFQMSVYAFDCLTFAPVVNWTT